MIKDEIKVYLGLIAWWEVTLIYFLISTIIILITYSKRQLKTQNELNQVINQWKEKLGIQNLKIVSDINSKSIRTNADSIKLGNIYKIVLTPNWPNNQEHTVVHELLHIKYKHCDVEEPYWLLHKLMNLTFDIIIDSEIIYRILRKEWQFN